jgi:hypothetical protein
VTALELVGDRADEAARTLAREQPQRRALAFAGDVSSEDEVRAAFDVAVEELGPPKKGYG